MIRDQRTMLDFHLSQVGRARPSTVDEVRQVWEAVAAIGGFSLHESGDTVSAYVSHGRWVAQCPNPLCCADEGINAEAAWPENPRWACLRCGVVCAVEFPDPAVIEGAAAILGHRKVHLRNWYPERESLADLQSENILMAPLPSDFVGLVAGGHRVGAREVLPQFQPGPAALPAGTAL